MSVDKCLKILIVLFLFQGTIVNYGQSNLTILKANSRVISIRDGQNLKKNVWNVDPGTKLDVYYADLPRTNHLVTFISDIDTISFDVSFGRNYDFIVLLNSKDSCHSRISANYNGISTYTYLVKKQIQGPDTLPFIMQNSRMYFEGSVNHHKGFIIQFDLGAGMSALNYKSVSKGEIVFDGKTNLVNTDGSNEEPTSSSSSIQIAGLNWDKVPMVQIKNMNNNEDAIVGNSLFENKVVEINYDKKIVIIHDTVPVIPANYTRHDIVYIQHRPYIKAGIIVDGKTYNDWFLFDTGRDGNMVLRDSFFRRNNIWDKLKTVFVLGNKHVKVVPQLQIGEKIFTNVITPAYNPAKMRTDRPNLIGNKLLNHFNVILDNQNGFIYLTPNSLQNNSYETLNSFKLKAGMLLFGIIAVIGVGAFFIVRWKKKKLTPL